MDCNLPSSFFESISIDNISARLFAQLGSARLGSARHQKKSARRALDITARPYFWHDRTLFDVCVCKLPIWPRPLSPERWDVQIHEDNRRHLLGLTTINQQSGSVKITRIFYFLHKCPAAQKNLEGVKKLVFSILEKKSRGGGAACRHHSN